MLAERPPLDPPPATSEQDLVSMLALALAPVPVWWGYAPAEEVEKPPSLPLVVVVRTSAVVRTDWADMCEEDDAAPIPADVTLQVRVWHPEYSAARALQASVRATLRALQGWAVQSEFDARDADLRAWAISSDWLAVATVLE